MTKKLQYLDGNRFTRPCVGATFDRSTGRCTIMDDAITPNGQLQYTPERETVYFEKICIPRSLITFEKILKQSVF